ncbi:MAG: hypothetical protein OEX81_05900 [Candidatus Pacebacteria bacterium]|nr:hypothetical protein [Candidatus Paceibacterota bacterium]
MKDHNEYLKAVGKYFGYPECCTNQFIHNHGEQRLARFKAGKGTGFVPCSAHAKEINDGDITLESLVINREHKFAFPYVNKNLFNEFINSLNK